MITMALVDPYSLCPCGSNKKFKWCCQKVEPHAERAQRLVENNQFDAAISVLTEGLTKTPQNPLLLLLKARILMAQRKPQEARQCVAAVLAAHPEHPGAASFMLRLILESGDAVAAAAELQRMLARFDTEARRELARSTALVAINLSKEDLYCAAFKHLELARSLDDSNEKVFDSLFESLRSNPLISPWLKDTYALEETPDRLADTHADQFDQALDWADEGLWSAAASAFDLLTAVPAARVAAERNLGLCRLWLGEQKAGVLALRRWLEHASPVSDAVDLGIVTLLLDETPDREPVEQVQLTWPLRDRKALMETLIHLPDVIEAPDRRLDPADKASPEYFAFYLLDRPKVDARPDLTRQEIPLMLGEVLIGAETVVLETHDDGRLNSLIERFTSLAGKTIPPSHPRTKVIDQTSRSTHALSWHWYLPPDLPREDSKRLNEEQIVHLTTEVWPETPMVFLDGRTPLQAARSGGYKVLLRAAVLQIELSGEKWVDRVDWARFRARLGLEPEPAVEPQTTNLDHLHLARLASVPLDRLDDERLFKLYLRARQWGVMDVRLKAAHEIVKRPELTIPDTNDLLAIYGDLVQEAIGQGDRTGAMEWLRRGRAAVAPEARSATAPHWDMLEVRVKIEFDPTPDWVAELSIVLGRYAGQEDAKMVLTARLVEWGLLNVVPSPENPNQFHLDTRPLQQLLSTHGPRVSASSNYVGVSATKGDIWTPEKAGGGSGSAIWTPGSDGGESASGNKPRIILPGQ
jgi:hypothetical protein